MVYGEITYSTNRMQIILLVFYKNLLVFYKPNTMKYAHRAEHFKITQFSRTETRRLGQAIENDAAKLFAY